MGAPASFYNGGYFTANSVGNSYYIWYNKDNSGIDPKPTGLIGIEVDVSSADTVAQVAIKTVYAINGKYYATPNYRGMFLRGWDPNAFIDPDANTRYNLYLPFRVGGVGSDELDDFLSHNGHALITGDFANLTFGSTGPTNEVGGYETRPINSAVNYVIKY